MQYTTNYGLTKLELSDSPADITEINDNWETIDEKLKEHADMLDGTTGSIAFTNKENTFTQKQKIKTISPSVQLINPNASKGTSPSSNLFWTIAAFDKNFVGNNESRVGAIDFVQAPNGTNQLRFIVHPDVENSEDTCSVIISVDKENNGFVKGLTPKHDSNDDTFATTEWVRDRIPELAPEPDLSDYVKSVNNVTPDPSGNVTLDMPDFVPSGTKMLFYEAAAPTGWTIDSSVNDVGVRIVSSNGGTVGGSTAFSSIFKSGTITTSSTSVSISGNTGNRQLTVAMLASHNHGINSHDVGLPDTSDGHGVGSDNVRFTTTSVGSNGTHNHSFSGSSSHTHNITLNLKYINVIVCSKD